MAERVCPNCGESGDPRHHWLDQPGVFEGYVCFGTDSEDEVDAMEHTIDTFNRQLVGMQGDWIVVAMPQTRMTKAEALVHAAWIVALADDDDTFPEVLAVVQES